MSLSKQRSIQEPRIFQITSFRFGVEQQAGRNAADTGRLLASSLLKASRSDSCVHFIFFPDGLQPFFLYRRPGNAQAISSPPFIVQRSASLGWGDALPGGAAPGRPEFEQHVFALCRYNLSGDVARR